MALLDFVAQGLLNADATLTQRFCEVARGVSGAAKAALYVTDGSQVRCLGLAPPHLGSPLIETQDEAHFPWAMGRLQPSRFILVEDAMRLPLAGGGFVGDLGLRSAVHLPMGAGSTGALHLYWDRVLQSWDDDLGAQLRAAGGLVVAHALDRRGESTPTRRRSDP